MHHTHSGDLICMLFAGRPHIPHQQIHQQWPTRLYLARISTFLPEREHNGAADGNENSHLKGLLILPEMERTTTGVEW